MALNIADIFEHAADAFGSRIAVICGDRQVTYRELDERANRLAHHLAGTGWGRATGSGCTRGTRSRPSRRCWRPTRSAPLR